MTEEGIAEIEILEARLNILFPWMKKDERESMARFIQREVIFTNEYEKKARLNKLDEVIHQSELLQIPMVGLDPTALAYGRSWGLKIARDVMNGKPVGIYFEEEKSRI